MRTAPTLGGMDDREAARAAVREFLSSRRDRVSPTDAGLPVGGSRRRVKGLRREEVALLAGVSPEYYIRLERGQATGPSAGVVESVATVLHLDDDERSHLDRLLAALTPEARKRPRTAVRDTVSPGVRVLLDSLDHLPAVVFNSRLDVLAANALARALYAPVFDSGGPPNTALFMFLDEHRARLLFPQWERLADDTVSILRVEAGRRPDDRWNPPWLPRSECMIAAAYRAESRLPPSHAPGQEPCGAGNAGRATGRSRGNEEASEPRRAPRAGTDAKEPDALFEDGIGPAQRPPLTLQLGQRR